MAYPLSICTWVLTFSSSKFRVSWTLFFVPSLNLIFAGYTGSKNPVQTGGKKPVQQTQNFKLENVQNQVQRDRRLLRLVLFVLFLFVKSKKTHSKFGIENSWKYEVISSKDSILKIFSFLKYFRHWSPAINGIQKISKVLYPPPLIWSNHQSWRPCLTWMNQKVATKIMKSIF